MELSNAVVIDNGSGMMKAGLSGQDADWWAGPSNVFHSFVGRVPDDVFEGRTVKTGRAYFDSDVLGMLGLCKVNYPIKHGIVSHWEDMTLLWEYTFGQLRVSPDEHPILLTVPPLNATSNRENMITTMFETFSVPAVQVANTGLLALYSTGRTTGIVFDSGDGVSVTQPIYEGFTLPYGVRYLDVCGRDMTSYMIKALEDQGVPLRGIGEVQIARDIKETQCYVAEDYEAELKKSRESKDDKYELPDGTFVSLGAKRFQIPEALFRPSIYLEGDHPGIAQVITGSIFASDMLAKRHLWSNIVLVGGNTLYPGLVERLRSEVLKIPYVGMHFKIIAPPQGETTVWIGGSILSSLSSFKESWITKEHFEEVGMSAMSAKDDLI